MDLPDPQQFLARSRAEDVLAERALDGIEEEVWYRGELVGTRRRYDSRLLLAHIARLDRQLEAQEQGRGHGTSAERFDEVVAMVAGAEVPADMIREADGLPCPAEAQLEHAAEAVSREMGYDIDTPQSEQAWDAYDDAVVAAEHQARAAARIAWDAWCAAVCDTVDRVTEMAAQDSVNLSTSDGADCRSSPARGGGPPAQRVVEGCHPLG